MKRFSKIEAVVTDILETMPATRSDDYLLMLFVTEQMKPCLLDKTLAELGKRNTDKAQDSEPPP